MMKMEKNILYLTLSRIDSIDQGGIYADLIKELLNQNINVTVVSALEKRNKMNTRMEVYGDFKNLQVKIGNITKTKSLLEKGISTLSVEFLYGRAIKKYLHNEKYDLILYSTPPITFNNLVSKMKSQHDAKSYLMLKDIFPQNAVDLDIMNEKSLPYRFFKNKEKKLYMVSDRIGCMSPANIDYIKEHNKFLKDNILEEFPNSIKIIDAFKVTTEEQIYIRRKYNLPLNKTIFLYGGNLGKPQGIDFLIEVLKNFEEVKNGFMLIIGSGTEFERLELEIKSERFKNVRLEKKMAKNEYDELIKSVDVGLLFLDHRFTIPNFPSRLTSYLENALPVIAATDPNTDVGEILLHHKSGYWCESNDVESWLNLANKLSQDCQLRKTMGENGRRLLEEKYSIEKNIDIILKHL